MANFKKNLRDIFYVSAICTGVATAITGIGTGVNKLVSISGDSTVRTVAEYRAMGFDNTWAEIKNGNDSYSAAQDKLDAANAQDRLPGWRKTFYISTALLLLTAGAAAALKEKKKAPEVKLT
jgi:hypothetical protein